MTNTINLGIIGLGTVGTGTVQILSTNKDCIKNRLGADIVIKKIADLDIKKGRGLDLSNIPLTTNAKEIIDDPDIDIVLELIGGDNPAKEFILSSIDKGLHVVTANKALLAKEGEEIFSRAYKRGVEIGFEACVGGGIPIIRSIKEGFSGNSIKNIYGIVNGTANFILSKMTDEGSDFNEVLTEAQEAGYAEADPAFDIEGVDSAHKIAILASLAFGTTVKFEDVYTEGISDITKLDIQFASEFGCKIKLLAIAKNDSGLLDIRVHPAMIKANHPLSSINGVLNAIEVTGDAAGENMLTGYGAGALPTGSAVVSDIIDIGRNILCGAKKRISPFSYQPDTRKKLAIKPIDEISAEYYLRFMVIDKPGVLSKISGILGDHQISVASVIQKIKKNGKAVPLVIMTHIASESNIQKALSQINTLDIISGKGICIKCESLTG